MPNRGDYCITERNTIGRVVQTQQSGDKIFCRVVDLTGEGSEVCGDARYDWYSPEVLPELKAQML